MNRAERRRFERIGIHAKEIEEVVAKKTQDKFDVAFSILIDTLSVSMRNNRLLFYSLILELFSLLAV